jgi:hypothetical protein
MISSGWADGLSTALAGAYGATQAGISAAITTLTPANSVGVTAGPGTSVSPLGNIPSRTRKCRRCTRSTQ